jgi:hypothetical protein
MREESYQCKLSENKRYTLRAVNRLAIGVIIVMWGILLAARQVGILAENVSMLPFCFVAFGILLIFGGIYRLHAGEDRPRRAASSRL